MRHNHFTGRNPRQAFKAVKLMSNIDPVVGVILAGGLARRMGGGDKCLLPLVGKTLLQRTLDRAQPQVQKLILSANGNSLRFARTRLPVVADIYPNNRGPLAGIHAALEWMHDNTPTTQWLMSFASDTPFFPSDLVEKLLNAATTNDKFLAVASSLERRHPTFALWHISLKEVLAQQLSQEQVPRLQDWIEAQHAVEVNFDAADYDPFFNINTPQDLYAAEPMVPLVK